MNHRIKPLMLLLLLAFATTPAMQEAQAQRIYRVTDSNGNVTFSDSPQDGGREVVISPLPILPAMAARSATEQTSTPQPIAPPASATAEPASQRGQPGQPFMPYDTFAISTPINNQTLPVGAAGNVPVTLSIQPALRKDHRVRLLLGGDVSQSAMHSTTFMLSNLNRGTHQLQAELLDASGTVRHRTEPRVIHVQRASINLPQNPNNPRR